MALKKHDPAGPYIQDGEGKNRNASEQAKPAYKNHHIT
jgi:hypothetical protein